MQLESYGGETRPREIQLLPSTLSFYCQTRRRPGFSYTGSERVAPSTLARDLILQHPDHIILTY